VAVVKSMDLVAALREQLAAASPDVLRELVEAFANALMSAEADAVCGAPYGEVSAERVNRRNGYRGRPFDTRVGSLELRIPKLRTGSYFPDWLLERRQRAETVLTTVVATCYLLGVSTRRLERLAEALGITRLSKSQVSEMAKELDGLVESFRTRPLDQGPYRFVWADALVVKVREGGRIVGVHVLIATGVNAEGRREILGCEVTSAEDGAGWLAFFRSLVARGLHGVQLVTSDAHPGLVAAIRATLPGASWQRCRTHYLRELLTKVAKSSQPWVATLVRTIFEQPDATAVKAQFDRVVETLEAKLPVAAAHLQEAREDLLAFSCFPRQIWRQIWSSNPQERLHREIRRRTDVVGIFPDRNSIVRLIGAVLMEQTDEWTVSRRSMGTEILTKVDQTIAAPASADPPSVKLPGTAMA
jgi:putative transposase